MSDPVREITVKTVKTVKIATGKVLRLITNDLNSPATEIAQLYKMLWQVELFFKVKPIQLNSPTGPTPAQHWPNTGPTLAQHWPNTGPNAFESANAASGWWVNTSIRSDWFRFSWIKQKLKLGKFPGRSENAVRTQIFTALIADLLLCLAHASQTVVPPLATFVRLVSLNLMPRRPITRPITRLTEPPDRAA